MVTLSIRSSSSGCSAPRLVAPKNALTSTSTAGVPLAAEPTGRGRTRSWSSPSRGVTGPNRPWDSRVTSLAAVSSANHTSRASTLAGNRSPSPYWRMLNGRFSSRPSSESHFISRWKRRSSSPSTSQSSGVGRTSGSSTRNRSTSCTKRRAGSPPRISTAVAATDRHHDDISPIAGSVLTPQTTATSSGTCRLTSIPDETGTRSSRSRTRFESAPAIVPLDRPASAQASRVRSSSGTSTASTSEGSSDGSHAVSEVATSTP